MQGIDGRVALVTGGTRGIGLACAKRLAAEGAHVALCGRDAGKAEEAARGIADGARGYACDVADTEQVDALVARVEQDLGPIAILVNNAGITRDNLLMRTKERDWADVLDTNLSAMFRTCKATARSMLKQRYGRIINLTSIVGLRGQSGQANYAAAKAGIIGFTKAYAQEIGSRGITVNAVAPGFVETDMTAGIGDAIRSAAIERIPLRRLGSPDDVAGSVAFLASDDGAYITGSVLVVDGGLAM